MQRPKLKDIPIVADDLNAVLDMSIRSIKLGRPAKFEDSAEGLEDFKAASIAYLEFVRETNNNPECENNLIPDVESWATYVGTTRKTILGYEKNRGEEWQEFISLIKGSITACKKQLAFRQKIPTVLALFDLTNNSGYVNSSEFKLQPGEQAFYRSVLTVDELPVLRTPDEIAKDYGKIENIDFPELPEPPGMEESEVKQNEL